MRARAPFTTFINLRTHWQARPSTACHASPHPSGKNLRPADMTQLHIPPMASLTQTARCRKQKLMRLLPGRPEGTRLDPAESLQEHQYPIANGACNLRVHAPSPLHRKMKLEHQRVRKKSLGSPCHTNTYFSASTRVSTAIHPTPRPAPIMTGGELQRDCEITNTCLLSCEPRVLQGCQSRLYQ